MEPIVPQQESSALDPSAALSPAGDPVAEAGEAPPRPTGAWSAILGAILLYLGGMLVGGLLAVLVLAILVSPWGPPPPHGPPPPSLRQAMTQPRFFVLSLTLVEACITLFVLLAGRNTGRPWRERLGLVRGRVPARELPLLVLASLGALGLGFLLVGALQRVGLLAELGKSRGYAAALKAALSSATPATRVAVALSGSVLVGLAEELVFRGYLQRALLMRWRPVLAIGVSSVIFAAMHGDLAYDVYVLPVGVLLGYVAWCADSIVPTIVCHASVNALAQTCIAVFGKVAARSAGHVPGAHRDTPALAWLTAAALVVCAALVWIGIWRVQRSTRITSV
jgi:membrane protease YdiL (CAAX protease family)